MKNLLLYGLVVLSFMGVITAQWYDRTQLQAEIERLKNQPPPAPEVIIKEVPTIWERVEYRDKPVREVVETIQIQEVIKEVKVYPPPLRNFESLPALREWLAKNMSILWAMSGQTLDCEDYAADIQARAYKDGWNVWQAPVTGGQIWGIRVTSVDDYHMGNMTRVGETFYYIETSPPNQGRIVPLLNKD